MVKNVVTGLDLPMITILWYNNIIIIAIKINTITLAAGQ